MEVTNKTLGLLLIAAIVVSLGGTFVSLNKLDGVSTTGYATNNETGTVTLTVGNALSIALQNTNINFGECIPDVTATLVLDSSQGSGAVNNSACSGVGGFPDSLVLQNDGNVHANVTVRTDTNGTNIFTPTSALSVFSYSIGNVSGTEGCVGNMQTAMTEFTIEDDNNPVTTTDEYLVCDNLTYNDGSDEVEFFARLELPAGTTDAVSPINVTFEASVSGI